MSDLSVRGRNRVTVLRAVLSTEVRSRAEVIERTGLSKATVSRVVDELIREGLIFEGESIEREGRGRRSQLLRLGRTLGCVVGVDLGLTLTRFVAMDLRGRELARLQWDSPVEVGLDVLADHVVAGTRALLAEASGAGPLRFLVAAVVPRVVDLGTGGVRRCSGPAAPAVEGAALGRRIGEDLATEVRLDSDSNMALQAEIDSGAHGPHANLALMTVSSALGAAVALRGEILRGPRTVTGDLGIVPFGPTGEGLESVLGIRGLRARADHLGIADLDPAALIDPADDAHRLLRAEVRDALKLAVIVLAVTVDPDVVLFNGRLKPLAAALAPEVQEALAAVLAEVPRLAPTETDGYLGARGAGSTAVTLASDRWVAHVGDTAPARQAEAG